MLLHTYACCAVSALSDHCGGRGGGESVTKGHKAKNIKVLQRGSKLPKLFFVVVGVIIYPLSTHYDINLI